jgi:PIN like domain
MPSVGQLNSVSGAQRIYGPTSVDGLASVRDQFPEFYQPTPRQFTALWRDAIIAIDANVLLDIFRYSTETTKQLFSVLEDLGERIWIPHQAAFEYQKNRHAVGVEAIAAYDDAIKQLDAVVESLKSALKKNAQSDEMLAGVTKAFTTTKQKLDDARERHSKLVPLEKLHDDITKLLDGKIGPAFAQQELAARIALAEARTKDKVPPGYKDSGKKTRDKYGDILIWFQILEHAKAAKKPIILVTGDAKEDWWWIQQGKTLGPRPELRREIFDVAAVDFYIYSPERFLENARRHLGANVTNAAISEARKIQSSARIGGSFNQSLRAFDGLKAPPGLFANDMLKLSKLTEANSKTLNDLLNQRSMFGNAGSISDLFGTQLRIGGSQGLFSASMQAAAGAKAQLGVSSALQSTGLLADAVRRQEQMQSILAAIESEDGTDGHAGTDSQSISEKATRDSDADGER